MSRPLFTITLDDLEEALAKEAIYPATLDDADIRELEKRLADGLMGGFNEIADAAVDCMLLDRAFRRG